MAFDVVIQKNSSEKNKFDKSLTTISTLSGTLREGTSIINPTITFQTTLSTLKTANYMTISEFGRSYFITDIRSTANSLVEVSAHVDVLSSFKNEICSNRAIIKRQENKWNLYLNDGTFRVYQNPKIVTKAFPYEKRLGLKWDNILLVIGR